MKRGSMEIGSHVVSQLVRDLFTLAACESMYTYTCARLRPMERRNRVGAYAGARIYLSVAINRPAHGAGQEGGGGTGGGGGGTAEARRRYGGGGERRLAYGGIT
jgi:uncharacterized membrane protein